MNNNLEEGELEEEGEIVVNTRRTPKPKSKRHRAKSGKTVKHTNKKTPPLTPPPTRASSREDDFENLLKNYVKIRTTNQEYDEEVRHIEKKRKRNERRETDNSNSHGRDDTTQVFVSKKIANRHNNVPDVTPISHTQNNPANRSAHNIAGYNTRISRKKNTPENDNAQINTEQTPQVSNGEGLGWGSSGGSSDSIIDDVDMVDDDDCNNTGQDVTYNTQIHSHYFISPPDSQNNNNFYVNNPVEYYGTYPTPIPYNMDTYNTMPIYNNNDYNNNYNNVYYPSISPPVYTTSFYPDQCEPPPSGIIPLQSDSNTETNPSLYTPWTYPIAYTDDEVERTDQYDPSMADQTIPDPSSFHPHDNTIINFDHENIPIPTSDTNPFKLELVVDIDHTLVHSTTDPKTEELYEISSEELDMAKFTLPGQNSVYYVKFRPHVASFLEVLQPLFNLHIYTMGTRAYAEKIISILDPHKQMFGKVLAREDHMVSGEKATKKLEKYFAQDKVLILDDREDVWRLSGSANLIKIEPFLYFEGLSDSNAPPSIPLSIQEILRTHPFPCVEESDSSYLEALLSLLRSIHKDYFELQHQNRENVDVREVLGKVRSQVLTGCNVVFSGIFPLQIDHAKLRNTKIWKATELFGGTVSLDIDDNTTHVIAVKSGTLKVAKAQQMGLKTIHLAWLRDSLKYFTKLDETPYLLPVTTNFNRSAD